MKVYGVYDAGDYYQYDLVAIYRNKEDAIKKAQSLAGKIELEYSHYEIEEHEVLDSVDL